MALHANKIAIVTGASQGIGLAIAKRLGLDGAKVVICSRKETKVQEAVEKLRSNGVTVEGTPCHVGLETDRQKLVDFTLEKYGKIDYLISNAGINPHYGDLLDVTEKIWDKLFEVNVKAGFLLSKLVVPHMEKVGGGNIVFTSSITGYTPFQGILAYSVTKTTLLGLTKALAMTLAPKKIRVNCIAPGVIKTDFSKALWDTPGNKEEEMLSSMIPLGRLGEVDDCAGVVSFLCSDQAKYITGESIMIAGGMNARL